MTDTKNLPEQNPDARIVGLFNERNEKAIAESQKLYGTYCRAIAVNILGDEQDAEECVNDTWLKAWNTIPPEQPTSLKSYFGMLIRCIAIDRFRTLRRRKRSRDMTVLLDELDETVPTEDITDELPELLTEFLRSLDANERNLFVGRYWHSYTPAVLGAYYGLSENAVNLRIMRIRKRLRVFLTERGYTV